MCPLSGRMQSDRQLEQRAFARSRNSKQGLGFAVMQAEGNAIEHDFFIERDGNIVKLDGIAGAIGSVAADFRWEEQDSWFNGTHSYLYPKIAKINLVTKKSTIRISTEEATTAWVVERPTPCVPPRVDMP